MKVNHTLDPIFDSSSKVLILGTMPSIKSREIGFYYAHQQNRFWKVFSVLFEKSLIHQDERIAFLQQYHIALFDVLKNCEIENSSDASIKNVEVNDLSEILEQAQIKAIFTTGKKAYDLYNKYLEKQTGIKAISLPSTSGANARMSLDDLVCAYAIIKDYL